MYASLHEINSLNVNVNLSIVLLQCVYVHFNTLKADFCLKKPHRMHFTVLGCKYHLQFSFEYHISQSYDARLHGLLSRSLTMKQ